jgi:hypothetical protein
MRAVTTTRPATAEACWAPAYPALRRIRPEILAWPSGVAPAGGSVPAQPSTAHLCPVQRRIWFTSSPPDFSAPLRPAADRPLIRVTAARHADEFVESVLAARRTGAPRRRPAATPAQCSGSRSESVRQWRCAGRSGSGRGGSELTGARQSPTPSRRYSGSATNWLRRRRASSVASTM